MTKYATMNPLGSTSPYDLFDNAQNFDTAINSVTAAIWLDRFGVSRHTWHGLEAMAKAAIAAFGYITLDSFQTGATLTLPNQVLRDTSTGEYYRWDGVFPKVVPAGSTPAGSGGISLGAWLSVGDATLRGALAGTGQGKGTDIVGYLAEGDGATAQTVSDRLHAEIWVEDFGARGGKEGDALIDSGPAIKRALAAALARGGGRVRCRSKMYRSTIRIEVPAGVSLVGNGRGGTAYNTTNLDSNGTVILFTGTGIRDCTVDNISDMDTGGGVVANPAYGAPGASAQLSSKYALLNFTNGDAVGVQRATLKPFSAGIHVMAGAGGGLDGIRAMLGMPGTTSLDNYRDEMYTGLAEDWDVGIWIDRRTQAVFRDVAVSGYWRTAGRLITCIAVDDTAPSSEYNRFEGCFFQGFKGSAVRGHDLFRVTAVTPSTIEIGWSKSHRFPMTGVLRSGAIQVTYTGLMFSGDKLTFTGCSDTTGISVGGGVSNRSGIAFGNFGYAGMSHIRCNFTGLGHASRLLATSENLASRFPTASSFCEISGDLLREIRFLETTFLGSDEVAVHLHDANDIQFTNCYGEGQTARSLPGGAFDITAGARIIASPFTGNNTRCPYPSGETNSYRDFGSDWNNSLDFTPHFPSTNIPRFAGTAGLFEPRLQINLGKGMIMSASYLDWYMPGNMPLRMGPVNGNFVMMAHYGEMDQRAADGSLLRWRIGGTTKATLSNAAFVLSANFNPSADNTYDVGNTTFRWKQFYAAAATINTSDARLKTDVVDINDQEKAAAREIKGIVRRYKFQDAVDEKGEQDARYHFGVLAQEVADIMEKNGLNARDYGFFCYDKWPDKAATYEEDGITIKDAAVKAGDRYGIRYSELLCFIISAM
ncbi:TPA: tail fiber domain-containing protein [Citrobacter freundii]|nr:tail fiber domain-containing protein [Citrobacter freundii]